jgi:hypothetical protein
VLLHATGTDLRLARSAPATGLWGHREISLVELGEGLPGGDDAAMAESDGRDFAGVHQVVDVALADAQIAA